MDRELKTKIPRTRLAGQQFEGNKEKSYTLNGNGFSETEPPPNQSSIIIKSFLVQLGVRGIIPRKLCTKLINLLGLRGA